MLRTTLLALWVGALLATVAVQPVSAQHALTDDAAAKHNDARNSVESTTVTARQQNEARIRAALDKTVDLDFTDTPLADVLASLAENYAIPIVIDSAALDFAGIKTDEPVTLKISGISLRSALWWLLRERQLSTTIRDQMLVVTTPEEAEEQLVTVVYPVRDLITSRRSDGTKEEDPDSLIALIESVVSPDSWDVEPLNRGFRGLLVINQQLRVQEEIQALLAALRKVPNVEQMSADERAQIDTTPVIAARHDHANIKRALQKQVTFDYVESPLQEVADDLSAIHQIPIMLDRQALEFADIKLDTPITISLSGVTLESALRHMLRCLDLDYLLIAETLLITTREECEQSPIVVVYPVADILEYGERNMADFESLIEVIVGTVAPDSWHRLGGLGSLHEFPQRGAIVCSQIQSVHDQIERLLSEIRKHRDQLSTHEQPNPNEVVLEIYQLFPTRKVNGVVQDVRADDVESLLIGLTDPELWQQNDAYIKTLPGRLVLRHRRAVHDQISHLLSRLGLRGVGGFGPPPGDVFSGQGSSDDSYDDPDELFSN